MIGAPARTALLRHQLRRDPGLRSWNPSSSATRKGSFTGASSKELGLFEAADGGTVFLDEIGEMNVAMQAKLLRAIQEKEIRRVGGKINIPVDVRIISATNKDLEMEIRKGAFREDLFYRLNVLRINLPPLRERGGDIVALADFFMKKYSAASGFFRQGDLQACPEAPDEVPLAGQCSAAGIGHRAGGADGGERVHPAGRPAGRGS